MQGGGRGAAATGQRPKSVQQWSVVDVQKWLRRHCGDYYHLYAESFLEQEVGPCLCYSPLMWSFWNFNWVLFSVCNALRYSSIFGFGTKNREQYLY